jgi:hypothetical protein
MAATTIPSLLTQRPRKNRPGSFIYDCRPCAAEEKDFRLSCSFAKKCSKWVDEQPRKNLILKIGFDKRQNPQSGLETRSASSVYVRVYLYTYKLVNHVTDVLIHLNNNVVPVFGHGKTEFRSDL